MNFKSIFYIPFLQIQCKDVDFANLLKYLHCPSRFLLFLSDYLASWGQDIRIPAPWLSPDKGDNPGVIILLYHTIGGWQMHCWPENGKDQPRDAMFGLATVRYVNIVHIKAVEIRLYPGTPVLIIKFFPLNIYLWGVHNISIYRNA